MLSYDFSSRPVRDILQDKAIDIPEHQRPEMWKPKKQEELIATIMEGRPMPNLTFREELQESSRKLWLEDGQQRYISMKKFMENKLPWGNRLYKDLGMDEQFRFQVYKLMIMTYSGGTKEDTIKIFDTFQNGVALSPGQRFHARLSTPLVKYARERLLTPNAHFHTRAAAVWGPHAYNKDTKTKRILMNAMALAGGAAHGVEFITTSYEILGPLLEKPFNATNADTLLDRLIRTYEAAEARHPLPKKQKNALWDAGKVSGYILASFLEKPDEIDTLESDWTDYLVSLREGKTTLAESLHANVPSSRNWNAARWRQGYINVFVEPPEAHENVSTGSCGEDTDNEDDD